MLSHPVTIAALVSHYLTNKLIVCGPIQGRNLTFDPKISQYYRQFPDAILDPWACNHTLLSLSPLSVFNASKKHFSHDLHA